MWETHIARWSQAGAGPPASLQAMPLHRSLCWPQCARWTRPESDQSGLQVWPHSPPGSSCGSEHHFLDPPSGGLSGVCCSPAGCQLHQLISALQDKEGHRSSLGCPPVGEREQPVARPCLHQGTPAPYRGWRQSQAGGPGLEPQQLG